MEQAAPKQRSPWLYVLLGCGGFAALTCLGVAIFFGVVVKKGSDMVAGVTDPEVREQNARKMLGELPEGYSVAMSMSVFGMVDTALLTDRPMLPDGGFEVGDHLFTYVRVMANEENKRTKAFFVSGEGDVNHLRSNGVNIDARDVIKRGNLTVDGRKVYYVAARGQFGTGPQANEDGLNASVLFDCQGDQLHVGVWSMRDPAPQKAAGELDLTGTVADESELAKFLKPMNPCGR
ncbi:MAG: hypothetical protein IAE78_31255 [Myxococcus sp.]|nr:hypothetical protein [Myxococcus sp.]